MKGSIRVVFLDRDGVINKKAPPHEYITSWKEFEFLPGAIDAIRDLSGSDYKIIIITNQRGIARGKMSFDDLSEIHSSMLEAIRKFGGRIDRIYFCPHDEGCECRKPLPGMLDEAAKEFTIDFQKSWVVGDSESDIAAGKSRNCRTIFIGHDSKADYKAGDLRKAVDIIMKE